MATSEMAQERDVEETLSYPMYKALADALIPEGPRFLSGLDLDPPVDIASSPSYALYRRRKLKLMRSYLMKKNAELFQQYYSESMASIMPEQHKSRKEYVFGLALLLISLASMQCEDWRHATMQKKSSSIKHVLQKA